MGNINIITDKEGEKIAQITLSMRCWCIVTELIKKYNSEKNLYKPPVYAHITPENIDEMLKPCYEKGKRYEVVQLEVFINDVSTFTRKDLWAFTKAIKKCKFQEEDGPKMHLVIIRDLIKKHDEITKTYVSSFGAMTVTEGSKND